ncbi:rve domain-containing protein/gag_pre-integrs domain-containing protein/UBN2_2 domain-containing protein, partial [Cephalotus follicularis]
KCMIYIPKIHT